MKKLKVKLEKMIAKLEKKILHKERWDTWMAGGWKHKTKN